VACQNTIVDVFFNDLDVADTPVVMAQTILLEQKAVKLSSDDPLPHNGHG
jgi:hypothetical protein